MFYENEQRCVGCGCKDSAACWDENEGQPCHWLVTDEDDGLGVCSCCPDELGRFLTGDRRIAVPINIETS